MVEPFLARGVRDLKPNEAIFRKELLERVERVFQRFGFLTIETPKIEPLEILKAKDAIGDENKLIFELKEENLGLRYDLTVSLARYVSMYQNLPLPFKRYYVGFVWRMDEPQRLRYREFTQADVDIIGGDPVQCNAEVIATILTVFDELGITVNAGISSRAVVEDALISFGVKQDEFVKTMRILDKMDKLDIDSIRGMLLNSLESGVVERILAFVQFSGTNEEKLRYIESVISDKSNIIELRDTLALLESYPLKIRPTIDLSVIRGLDYYTGVVMEFRHESFIERDGIRERRVDTISAGGRYSNLVKILGGKELGGVGMTLGIDRILDIMDMSKSEKRNFAKVFVANVKPENYKYALGLANMLRAGGIDADINTAKRNISNQLSYASSLGYRLTLIAGDREEREGKVNVRDMSTGNERELGLDSLVDEIGRIIA